MLFDRSVKKILQTKRRTTGISLAHRRKDRFKGSEFAVCVSPVQYFGIEFRALGFMAVSVQIVAEQVLVVLFGTYNPKP